MSIIDVNGEFKIYDMENKANVNMGVLNPMPDIDKKDVYQMKWASDNANMVCVLEKMKLCFIKNGVEEEPTPFTGYILDFNELKVLSVALDEIAVNPLVNLTEATNKV